MRAEDVGLSQAEYQRILELMGREPNDLELGLYGALWSEHCSYKSSKSLLAHLPNRGEAVVQGPGGNAGVVRLAEGVEIAFKVESHNHPSYVEPVQGAATGVGGILRDIIAMGARPIAVADALRFGTDRPSMQLLEGVVKGVGQYGNAIGIPTVTGDIGFSSTYRANPLVNVMALGVRRPQEAIGAATAEPGQLLVLVGQRTGRDGIHGASLLASRDFDEESQELRPTVQVGDPFLGKLLMETTLQAVKEGLLGALQDLGAAGLTSAVAELCESSGVGAVLWLDRVPLREPGLTPYEIMLSETQERMLMVVPEGNLSRLQAICEHYEILATVIGEVTVGHQLIIHHHRVEEAHLNTTWLVGTAPRRPVDELWWDGLNSSATLDEALPEVPSFSVGLLLKVLSHLDVRDRWSVYRQYDSMIQTRTVLGPGHDAAVLKLRGLEPGIALTVAGPGRWTAVDPYAGGAGAVYRALSALAAQGASPLGLTDGINAGNPDKPESYRAMAMVIRGVADAARATGVPVTGGNVSLHNETQGEPIWPTVIVGAVGRHPRPEEPVRDRLSEVGERLFLLNPAPLNWGGSAAAWTTGQPTAYPRVDGDRARRVLEAVRDWVAAEHPRAMRVIGDGGLGATLVRLWVASEPSLGIEVQLAEKSPQEKTLRFYNESPLQWIAVLAEDDVDRAIAWWTRESLAYAELGRVTESGLCIVDGRYQWAYSDVMAVWHQAYKEVEA